MRWKEDLVKDIRFNDYRDDLDWPFVDKQFCFENTNLPVLQLRSRDLEDFSFEPQEPSLIKKKIYQKELYDLQVELLK